MDWFVSPHALTHPPLVPSLATVCLNCGFYHSSYFSYPRIVFLAASLFQSLFHSLLTLNFSLLLSLNNQAKDNNLVLKLKSKLNQLLTSFRLNFPSLSTWCLILFLFFVNLSTLLNFSPQLPVLFRILQHTASLPHLFHCQIYIHWSKPTSTPSNKQEEN